MLKEKTKTILRELFYFLGALLLSFIVLELIWPNIILAYFNINYLILFFLIVALILLFFEKSQENKSQ